MSDITTSPEGQPAAAPTGGLDGAGSTLDQLETMPGLPDATVNELKKLRQEHKSYRERFTPYEQAFGQWSQSDRDAILSFAKLMDADPVAAARWMHDNAKSLAGDKWQEIIGAAKEIAQNPGALQAQQPTNLGQAPKTEQQNPGYMTREEFEQELARRESERTQRDEMERQKQQIIDKTDELGFGPSHWAHASLLSLARNNGGDLDAAAEALRQQIAGVSTEQLASKEAEASRTPAPANGATPAGQATGTPEERMKARLDAHFGPQGLAPPG